MCTILVSCSNKKTEIIGFWQTENGYDVLLYEAKDNNLYFSVSRSADTPIYQEGILTIREDELNFTEVKKRHVDRAPYNCPRLSGNYNYTISEGSMILKNIVEEIVLKKIDYNSNIDTQQKWEAYTAIPPTV